MATVRDAAEAYARLRDQLLPGEVNGLARIAKMLRLPQKTIAVALRAFFFTKEAIRVEPADAVMHVAAVDIACKICETHRPVERILECALHTHALDVDGEIKGLYMDCINKTEVEVCAALDFDFEVPDFYERLKHICKEQQLPANYSRRCWVILNDILMRPVVVFFTSSEIVYGALLVEYAAAALRAGGDMPANDALIDGFLPFIGAEPGEVSRDALEFIALEICSLYA